MTAPGRRLLHLVRTREAQPEMGAVEDGDQVLVFDEADPDEMVAAILRHDAVVVW